MAIRGITFSKQTVTSNDDAHIYKVLLAGRKGKTTGCNMSFDVDDIYISDGYFFAANRLIQISSVETIETPVVTAGTTYCRLVFELDMTKINTNTAFNQGYFKILSSIKTILIESNHDVEMLMHGKYPKWLKQRVLSDKGHLSNNEAAYYLSKIVGGSTKYIVLAHLSEQNNTEQLALKTLEDKFKKRDIDITDIFVARQNEMSKIFEI